MPRPLPILTQIVGEDTLIPIGLNALYHVTLTTDRLIVHRDEGHIRSFSLRLQIASIEHNTFPARGRIDVWSPLPGEAQAGYDYYVVPYYANPER